MLDTINAISYDLILPRQPIPANHRRLNGLAPLTPCRRIVAAAGPAALAFLSTTAGAQFFVVSLERLTSPLNAPERAGT